MCKDGEVISVILWQYQIWYKWRVYWQISKPYTWGPLVILPSPLLSFLSCTPSPSFLFFVSAKREERTREWEREREPPPGNRFARNSGNRKRNSNLAPSPVWLVNPLSISLSFRVFVFLGFRWKPVELHQIDYSVPLLFIKCLFVDFVFQFATKTRFSHFPKFDEKRDAILSKWLIELVPKPELRLYVP